MAEIAVGIDLGTSNTCVAVMRGDEIEVIPNDFGERISASVVHFHEDGSVEVGNSAKAKVIHSPAQTVSSAKRLIGRYFFSEEVKKAQAIYPYEIVEAQNSGVRIKIREEEFSLPEISAMVLREMKQVAEAHIGQDLTKAVITVPAYFNDNQRQATKDAGRIAGLDILRILNEPTAAALAYGFGMGLNQRVAVYDLGGGTFDISVLEIGKDIFEVLATCGDTFLGGEDFDDRLIDMLADEFIAAEGINPRNDPFAYEKLKRAAENAKIQLSIDDVAEVSIEDLLVGEDGKPRSLKRSVTREDLSTLVSSLIMRTFKVCDEALQQADLTVRDLDGVILVGGPTRLPIVRDAVASYFQQEPRSDVNPDEVVAIGAAIHAASLSGTTKSAMLLDVTPLDLRIGVAGGLSETIIDGNTPVPIEQTRTFTTFQDHQESVEIRIYQGDHRQAEDNALLGQFEFSGFQKGLRSDVKIDVTFEIDADGIVNVTASDQTTGEATSAVITLSSGLDDQEMAKILQADRASRVATTGDASQRATSPESSRALDSTSLELSPSLDANLVETADSPPEAVGADESLELGWQPTDDDELTDSDELMDDDELMALSEELLAPSEDVTLSIDAGDAADEDDGFFEASDGNLRTDPELEDQ